MVSAVLDRELFQQLQINVKGMWEQLLWLDSANWGGIRYRHPDEVVTQEQPLASTLTSDIVMGANVAALVGEAYRPDRDSERLETLRETEEDEDEWNDDDDDSGERMGPMSSNRRGEYDFLDEINEQVAAEDSDEEEVQVTQDEGGRLMESQQSLVEGNWDLVTLLPPAAGVYLRHTVGKNSIVIKGFMTLCIVRSIFIGVSRTMAPRHGECPRDLERRTGEALS